MCVIDQPARALYHHSIGKSDESQPEDTPHQQPPPSAATIIGEEVPKKNGRPLSGPTLSTVSTESRPPQPNSPGINTRTPDAEFTQQADRTPPPLPSASPAYHPPSSGAERESRPLSHRCRRPLFRTTHPLNNRPPISLKKNHTSMKDRVRKIMEHFHLTQMQFANELAVAPATISNIYKGKTAPTNNLVQAIHQAYPSVSINWLLFGEGDMLLPLSDSKTPSIEMPQEEAPLPTFTTHSEPTLFDISEVQPATKPTAKPKAQPSSTELQILEAITELKTLNNFDKKERKIKEIRVFYDDGTYESFGPNR